jgi:hypothetical protein
LILPLIPAPLFVSAGTRLELEHIAHVDGTMWDRFGPGAVGVGGDLALMGLGRHLASGAAVDRRGAEVWSASKEGRDFVGRSSGEWCNASTRRIYAVESERLPEVDAWLEKFRALWVPRLDALATEIARGKRKRREQT